MTWHTIALIVVGIAIFAGMNCGSDRVYYYRKKSTTSSWTPPQVPPVPVPVAVPVAVPEERPPVDHRPVVVLPTLSGSTLANPIRSQHSQSYANHT